MSNILGDPGCGDTFEEVLTGDPNISRENLLAAIEFGGELSRFEESPYGAAAPWSFSWGVNFR